MKVIYKSDVTKPVSDVKCGQCFMKNGSVFMKAYKDFEYAVDLEDGKIYEIVNTKYKVIPVEAEVIIK